MTPFCYPGPPKMGETCGSPFQTHATPSKMSPVTPKVHHLGTHGLPREANGFQNASKRVPNSSKNGILRPAFPRRPPKPPHRSKKPPKSKENRHKTASSPRGKIRVSGALQRTASQVCPRTSRKNSRWWRPSEDKIAGVSADLVENIGAPHHCTHPPSAADWAKPNWIRRTLGPVLHKGSGRAAAARLLLQQIKNI